jgi:hypothetical protein
MTSKGILYIDTTWTQTPTYWLYEGDRIVSEIFLTAEDTKTFCSGDLCEIQTDAYATHPTYRRLRKE